MATMTVRTGFEEASIQAVVIRCGCGDPLALHPNDPCPTPRASENRGTISYWHKNPLRRAGWMVKQWLR